MQCVSCDPLEEQQAGLQKEKGKTKLRENADGVAWDGLENPWDGEGKGKKFFFRRRRKSDPRKKKSFGPVSDPLKRFR